jgi:hypothetical protein
MEQLKKEYLIDLVEGKVFYQGCLVIPDDKEIK